MLNRIKSIYKRYFWTDEKYARSIGVKIGRGCKIATRYFGSEPYLIEIGNHVQITSDVRFSNHGAAWVLREKYPKIDFFGKIKIGNNVYIGNCSIILPGVSIGDNVIIGAGSVVTKSFPSNVIIGGNPAKVISDVKKFEETYLSYDLSTKGLDKKKKQDLLINLEEGRFIRK
ncbi:hypothetical protein SF1_01620 [Sphingobacterium faecium NBRC 15299]|uniref:acyltransferase n=1 Tax=Sphingobacterium faecium TaxID=34087 RepID=UPI000D342E81|nr:acyltransferase [Sphingobacterium faecium]PTX12471.1 transferase family hexapeptide repeat protein [Sphingobacterium faecium]GEM62180.1 hypothetical protein SF1_01620 [Sphingobacterium faecium NBRC 15299]